MQKVSEIYNEIISGDHYKETRLGVAPSNFLIAGITDWYGENMLISMSTAVRVFSKDTPSVGNCASGEINVVMLKPSAEIPRQALLVPQIRITDGKRYSEWISKGKFYVDTRSISGAGTAVESITLHGYDDMMKAEQDYPSSTLSWPAKDINVVKEIAKFMGISLDPRTTEIMTKGYMVQYPSDLTCRETLGYIAAMYGGSFVMSDIGKLRLITMNSMPAETNFLTTENYDAITFGGDRILV
jgi:hypothetical protein